MVSGNSLCAKSLQLYPTLWDLMDCSIPGSPVHGILQARILGWIATPSSRGSSCSRDQTRVSHVYLLWQGGSILLDFPCGSDSKDFACNAGDLGSVPGLGRSLQKEMATHSCILAWRIQWTEKPVGLQSIGSQRS